MYVAVADGEGKTNEIRGRKSNAKQASMWPTNKGSRQGSREEIELAWRLGRLFQNKCGDSGSAMVRGGVVWSSLVREMWRCARISFSWRLRWDPCQQRNRTGPEGMGTSATSSSAAMVLSCLASSDDHALGQTEQRRDKRDAKRREGVVHTTIPGGRFPLYTTRWPHPH